MEMADKKKRNQVDELKEGLWIMGNLVEHGWLLDLPKEPRSFAFNHGNLSAKFDKRLYGAFDQVLNLMDSPFFFW